MRIEVFSRDYYIAAINIEAVFDEINGDESYTPFERIVLTDTNQQKQVFDLPE